MKNLMESYKKKMKSAETLLVQLNDQEDNDARIRITSQINCYNYFIFELERLMLINAREKQREEAQSLLIREVTEFNRQVMHNEGISPNKRERNDDKKLKLSSN